MCVTCTGWIRGWRPRVEEYLPSVAYRLDDLTRVDVDALRARVLTPPLRLTLLLLTQVPGNPRVDELLDAMKDDVVAVISEPNGAAQLQAAFAYIRSVSDVADERLGSVARKLGPDVWEAHMTTADQLAIHEMNV